jgi:hypothetical protein
VVLAPDRSPTPGIPPQAVDDTAPGALNAAAPLEVTPVKFTPTERELLVMRVLDCHPWRPPAAIAQAAGIADVGSVRSTLAELRRFYLVVTHNRIGGGAVGRYHLTDAGEAVLIDSMRQRALEPDVIAA